MKSLVPKKTATFNVNTKRKIIIVAGRNYSGKSFSILNCSSYKRKFNKILSTNKTLARSLEACQCEIRCKDQTIIQLRNLLAHRRVPTNIDEKLKEICEPLCTAVSLIRKLNEEVELLKNETLTKNDSTEHELEPIFNMLSVPKVSKYNHQLSTIEENEGVPLLFGDEIFIDARTSSTTRPLSTSAKSKSRSQRNTRSDFNQRKLSTNKEKQSVEQNDSSPIKEIGEATNPKRKSDTSKLPEQSITQLVENRNSIGEGLLDKPIEPIVSEVLSEQFDAGKSTDSILVRENLSYFIAVPELKKPKKNFPVVRKIVPKKKSVIQKKQSKQSVTPIISNTVKNISNSEDNLESSSKTVGINLSPKISIMAEPTVISKVTESCFSVNQASSNSVLSNSKQVTPLENETTCFADDDMSLTFLLPSDKNLDAIDIPKQVEPEIPKNQCLSSDTLLEVDSLQTKDSIVKPKKNKRISFAQDLDVNKLKFPPKPFEAISNGVKEVEANFEEETDQNCKASAKTSKSSKEQSEQTKPNFKFFSTGVKLGTKKPKSIKAVKVKKTRKPKAAGKEVTANSSLNGSIIGRVPVCSVFDVNSDSTNSFTQYVSLKAKKSASKKVVTQKSPSCLDEDLPKSNVPTKDPRESKERASKKLHSLNLEDAAAQPSCDVENKDVDKGNNRRTSKRLRSLNLEDADQPSRKQGKKDEYEDRPKTGKKLKNINLKVLTKASEKANDLNCKTPSGEKNITEVENKPELKTGMAVRRTFVKVPSAKKQKKESFVSPGKDANDEENRTLSNILNIDEKRTSSTIEQSTRSSKRRVKAVCYTELPVGRKLRRGDTFFNKASAEMKFTTLEDMEESFIASKSDLKEDCVF